MIALRILGYLWSSPVTLAGLLVAIFGGSTARGPCRGALEFISKEGWPLAWFFRTAGVAAFTWGAVIVYRDHRAFLSLRLNRHERRHVWQQLILGPLIVPAYLLGALYAWLREEHPYRDNPLERDARAHED